MKPAFILFLLLVTPAVRSEDLIDADRPGIADGSHVVKRKQFQIEIGFDREHQGAERSLSTPTLLRFGLTNGLEARLETDAYTRTDHVTHWAPVSLGFKAHLAGTPSLGVIGRIFRHRTGDLRLVGDFTFGERWSINPNAGVAFEKGFTAAIAALTVQYNFNETSNVFVDGGLQAPEERHGGSSLLLDTGAAWILGRDTQLDLSIGWGARGSTTPNIFISGGVSRRF